MLLTLFVASGATQLNALACVQSTKLIIIYMESKRAGAQITAGGRDTIQLCTKISQRNLNANLLVLGIVGGFTSVDATLTECDCWFLHEHLEISNLPYGCLGNCFLSSRLWIMAMIFFSFCRFIVSLVVIEAIWWKCGSSHGFIDYKSAHVVT